MSPFSIVTEVGRTGPGGGGGGGGWVRSNPLRTGLAAATSVTWYSRSDDVLRTVFFNMKQYRSTFICIACVWSR